MKKLVSILLTTFIVLSGLNLSVATHFCGGELAAYKISLTGQHASCGMEDKDRNASAGYGFKSHCCDNTVSTFSVDHNYTPSFKGINYISQKIIHVFALPVTEIGSKYINNHSFNSIFRLQSIFPTNAVALAFICVFRK